MDSLTHFHSRNVYFNIHYSNRLKVTANFFKKKKIKIQIFISISELSMNVLKLAVIPSIGSVVQIY